MELKLGDIARDTVTGYEGTVTARTSYLNGCIRVQLQAKALKPDGSPVDSVHTDEPQCEVVTPAHAKPTLAATGGPRDATRGIVDTVR